ncbi:hypothetical protein [Methanosarcina sp.]|uniref:hypothetical protein n=1 Tax=Methanosarcina sp. TaxID=2213 RepID=UPI002AB88AB4|nr:hypothetical protein [Methanosarcina sp.]MDY9927857.1 hypothetical protein [Methanosarcina sp.]
MADNNSSINIASNNRNDSLKNVDTQYEFEKTVIGNNNNVVYKENQNIVQYKGFKKDVFFLAQISPYVIRKIGKKNVKIVGLVSFISGLITIYLWVSSFNYYDSSLVHNFVSAHLTLITYCGIILFAISFLCVGIKSYHSNTTCKNCNKEFAYEELENPDVKDVKTADGYMRTIKRHYTCQFCGFKETISFREKIKDGRNSFIK